MQRDKGLYRRCYGQEFGLIAWCWNMNFESIMCHGELRDEHGPALRVRTLDIVSRLVVVSGKLDVIGVGEGINLSSLAHAIARTQPQTCSSCPINPLLFVVDLAGNVSVHMPFMVR